MGDVKNFLTWSKQWMSKKGWQPQKFQLSTWKAVINKQSGLVNAPTGSGKTLSLLPAILWPYIQNKKPVKGLICIWVTPLRSLSQQISISAETFIEENNLEISVGVRNGDTSTSQRAKQNKQMPNILITTPESLQLILCSKGWEKKMNSLRAVVVDEWHELIGSKRGVQVELCLAGIKSNLKNLIIWGISATIGNLVEAKEVLLGFSSKESILITSKLKSNIEVKCLSPKKIEEIPWKGHLGLHLIDLVIPVLNKSKSTLIFTNTRSQCEIWYQNILAKVPDLAGNMAMHHGSIDRNTRLWIEQAIRMEKLKVVICTSSLDLGVDFYPVETIIQIGGPKGVARFIQRAGRSGHRPNEKSVIYFLPTHAIELIEAAALKKAVKSDFVESRVPYVLSFDVLIQFLISLAVADGFYAKTTFELVRSTHAFNLITELEWNWILKFITIGSRSLSSYDEYKKVEIDSSGLFKVSSRRVAMRHRVQIGTIVSDAHLEVKMLNGRRLGQIEEWFISKLKKGDVFLFAGQFLQIFQVNSMRVTVKKSKSKKGKIVSWMGGRMSFSSYMSELLREELYELNKEVLKSTYKPLSFLVKKQKHYSTIPNKDQFLIESFKTREGYHTIFYPFEGRFVHEALSHLLAYRLSLLHPITFSLAFNDYGFELLSDQYMDVNLITDNNLFDTDHLNDDLLNGLNLSEMARRKFRDIAVVSGLIFSGMPNNRKKNKDLQSSSQLVFDVLRDYENDNLLYKQALNETFDYQIEEHRLRLALIRINNQSIIWNHLDNPSPFSYPIITDRLREHLSSEDFDDRIEKMMKNFK
tara:strand:- start:7449 stop:9881 length:2433 start_codon:yes stop_codon:yes gene_type:complete